MQQNIISINKPFLSLVYDTATSSLVGDTEFELIIEDVGDEPNEDKIITIEHGEDVIVTPDSFEASNRPTTITIELAEGITPEEGNYNLELKFNNSLAAELISNVALSAKTVDPEPNMVYVLKYYILREGYRLNIYQNVIEGTVIEPIEVNGTCELSYQERKDLYTPIISSSLKINLEASLDLDFNDLYTEDEKTFKAEVIKDSNVVFLGFIFPDGIWEDFVTDRWVLTLNASDGLSTLKNISFSNENGLNFYGRMTAMNIIYICLKKTGFDLHINVICYIEYLNMFNVSSIFSNIFMSTERYFQNEDEPMNCEDVLKSILQCFNCTIEFRNGEWIIYKSTDLRSTNLVNVIKNGLYNKNLTIDFGATIGSDINGFQYYHCNGNQKKSISPSVQAYQISYDFGIAKNVVVNGGLFFQGTQLDAYYGINMPGWTIPAPPDGSNKVAAGVNVGGNYGLRSVVSKLDPLPAIIDINQSITVNSNNGITLSIKYKNFGQNSLYLNFALAVVNGSSTLWFDKNTGIWGNSYVINRVDNYHQEYVGGSFINYGNGDAIYELSSNVPMDGNVFIRVLRNGHGPGNMFGIHSIFLKASDNNVKSKEYKSFRTSKKSTNIKSNVTVYNGDSLSNLFVGTIFKNDSNTPTSLWNRFYYSGSGFTKINIDESKELLSISAEENLSISPQPMILFEGDFKGFIPHCNIISIDGFTDKKFQFSKYIYSFDTDITKAVLLEYSDTLLNNDDFVVQIKENFGNETKVTIKDV